MPGIDLSGFVEPIKKLIEVISGAIGTWYEPTHTKRMTKAKADELEQIAEAMERHPLLPMSYENNGIKIDTTDINNMMIRAQNRFLFQQLKKQQNIETVVDVAYQELADKPPVSDDPLDSDWISSFFDFIANISDDKMQTLWGKLLADEVVRPGSFSIRTLDTLRKLTHREVTLFEKIAPYILHCPANKHGSFDDYFLIAGEYLEKYGIEFPIIQQLNEAELISSYDISVGFSLAPNASQYVHGMTKSLLCTNSSDAPITLQKSAYILSNAGKELLSLPINAEAASDTYYSDCRSELLKEDFAFDGEEKSGLTVTIETTRAVSSSS